MNTLFSRTQSTHRANTRIQHLKKGQVFFHNGSTFVVLHNPMPSAMVCSRCGSSEWNVHNFACAVHFCTNHDWALEISDIVLPVTN